MSLAVVRLEHLMGSTIVVRTTSPASLTHTVVAGAVAWALSLGLSPTWVKNLWYMRTSGELTEQDGVRSQFEKAEGDDTSNVPAREVPRGRQGD
jgi:hypothetical protein